MHTSIKLETPIEFINVTPLNPLISKCQIKVCYVGDTPNRNRSVITKDVARQMANSLPGSPIVGFYNEDKKDFEEHNRVIDISNGKFEIKDTTRPYGFVDLGAKVWFQKFLDDGINEHEYLMTEGYLWTGQYPECQRIVRGQGNNHSMELDENTLNATWSKDNNGKPKFFIINEAIISKLCVLGEECEPCFEGSNITAPTIQFSFEDGFKEQLFSMMSELKDLLNKGGEKVFTRYAVEVGDTLWTALYSRVNEAYSIEGVYEDEAQKFAILKSGDNFYRLDFSISESEEITFAEEVIEVESYTPDEEPQFSTEAVQNFVETFKKKKEEDEEEDKSGEDNKKDSDNNSEEDNNDDDEDDEEKKKKKNKFSNEDDDAKKCPECGKPVEECKCEKKPNYSLEEIPEYIELQNKYAALEESFNQLKADKEALDAQVGELTSFKLAAERKDKQDMIASFYMLSDEDKQDVVANIDTYSLDDIEAKLSIICVRNKVSFDLEDNKEDKGPTTFNLNGSAAEDESTPAWVKAALAVAKNMN